MWLKYWWEDDEMNCLYVTWKVLEQKLSLDLVHIATGFGVSQLPWVACGLAVEVWCL